MATNKVKAIALTSIDSADITGVYQPVNPLGLPFPCIIVRIVNNSDENITISYDGITDNDIVLENDFLALELQANALPNGDTALFPAGTVIFVKGTAGTGTIFIAGYYQPS